MNSCRHIFPQKLLINEVEKEGQFIMSGRREPSQSSSPRFRTLVLIVWIVAFHVPLTGLVRADFRILERTKELEVLISGTITEQDAKAIQALSAEMERNEYFYVNLDSTGGDVLAAMHIGRLIRKNDGRTRIGWPGRHVTTYKLDAKCYSSCALIFIVGTSRSITGLSSPTHAVAGQAVCR
jgi:hypothetical protein